MSLRSDACELDAGPAPQRLVLVSSASENPPARRELSVYRQSEDRRILRIVEAKYSGDETQPYRQIDRLQSFLDLTQDSVIPRYTIASEPQSEWNVEVVCGKGTSRIAYALRERKDAFEFQRLCTGYEPTEHFEGVSCSVTFKSAIQDAIYKGRGEIQLWQPEAGRSSATSMVPPSSRRTSLHGTSVGSTTRSTVVRRTSVLSEQTDAEGGTTAIICELPRPPVLVAFLKDNRNGYTMLKADSEFKIGIGCTNYTIDLNKLQISKLHLPKMARSTFDVQRVQHLLPKSYL